MNSLGTMVSLFSQKVEEKIVLIRELSLKHTAEAHGKRGLPDSSGLQTPESFGLKKGVRFNRVSQKHGWMTWSYLMFLIFLSRCTDRFAPWWRRSLEQVWSTSPTAQIRAAGRCCGCIDLSCGWSWCWRVWLKDQMQTDITKHLESWAGNSTTETLRCVQGPVTVSDNRGTTSLVKILV